MFLELLALSHTFPCLADPGKIIIVGKPDRLLTNVIPYLAALPGVITYNPEPCTITFRRQPGFLTIYPEKVFITQVQDADEGLVLLDALKDAINSTWDHRHELKPITVAQHAPHHLDIYTLLPQSNCKKCGEATCLAFAVNLVLHKRQLEECIPLQHNTAFVDRRAALVAMLV
jgi:ArsR family metal-binding transcriptional regulator